VAKKELMSGDMDGLIRLCLQYAESITFPKNYAMTKFILMAVACFITSFVFAQEQYVEVIVKDTMMIEPQEWTIVANIEKKYDFTTADTTTSVTTTVIAPSKPDRKGATKKPDPPKEMSLDDLRKIVLRYNGQVVPVDSTMLYGMMGSGRYSYENHTKFLTVKFRNKEDMRNFMKAAFETKEIETSLVGTQHFGLETFYEALDAKLLESAKAKAQRLAQISGKKAGNIISVSEHVDQGTTELMRFFESILKLEALPGRLERYFMNSQQIKIEKSLRIRFALL